MMKAKDCAVATALVLNGYLRANAGDVLKPADETRHLADAINAIRQEVHDWAENLDVPEGEDANALEPDAMTIDAVVTGSGVLSRTPYNLVSVAIAALREAVDLAGPESVMSDFQSRSTTAPARRSKPGRSAPFRPAPVGAERVAALIEAAEALSAEIDAATERPVAKQTAWDLIVSELRGLGVVVEDRLTAPANW